MVKSVCGYTIFYQTDHNMLLSMEQHQVNCTRLIWSTLRISVGPRLFLMNISDINNEIMESGLNSIMLRG